MPVKCVTPFEIAVWIDSPIDRGAELLPAEDALHEVIGRCHHVITVFILRRRAVVMLDILTFFKIGHELLTRLVEIAAFDCVSDSFQAWIIEIEILGEQFFISAAWSGNPFALNEIDRADSHTPAFRQHNGKDELVDIPPTVRKPIHVKILIW